MLSESQGSIAASRHSIFGHFLVMLRNHFNHIYGRLSANDRRADAINTQFGHVGSIHGWNVADYFFRAFEIASEMFSSDNSTNSHSGNEKRNYKFQLLWFATNISNSRIRTATKLTCINYNYAKSSIVWIRFI